MTRLVFVVFLAGAVAGFAQQSPDAIPKDLVKLLLGPGMYGGSIDIVIGLPEGFPPELLPAGATAKIGTISSNGMMVIAEAPGLPSELPRYERQLANGGWKPPASPQMAGRGLLSSPAGRSPSMFCNGDRYATYTLSPRPAGGSYARVAVNTPARSSLSPCRPSESSERAYAPMSLSTEVDLPPLVAPIGSQTRYSSGSGGSDHYEQSLRLETTLPLAEVLRHYRAQAEKHGWTPDSEAVADAVAVMRYSVVSSKREPVVATLSIARVPGDDLEVVLRLTRASTRRTP